MSNESENTNPSAENPAAEAQAPVVDGTQTGQEAAPAQDSNPSPEKAGGPPDTVPYHRFQEVIRENQMLKQQRPQQEPARQQQADPFALPDENDPKYQGNYQAYLDDRADVIANRRFHQNNQQQQGVNRIQNAGRNLQQKIAEEGAKDPAVYDLPNVLSAFSGNPEVVIAMAEAPENVAILKHLKANPSEIYRLQGLSPAAQLMEIGRLSVKLAGSKEAPRKPSKDAPNLDLARPGNKPGTGDPYAIETDIDSYIAQTRPIPTR